MEGGRAGQQEGHTGVECRIPLCTKTMNRDVAKDRIQMLQKKKQLAVNRAIVGEEMLTGHSEIRKIVTLGTLSTSYCFI